ncbi:MAG TPA: SPOR domain-containing protein [Bacteroidota bacterium]|nr:SPOR domain-containing protein [Bacteroidota bacterium]
MILFKGAFPVFAIAAAMIVAGCSSSKQSEKTGSTTVQNPSETSSKPEGAKTDTFDVKVDNSKKPSYEPTATAAQPGNFAVQIGAYQKQENADRVAALARDRFAVTITTVFDRTKGLWKVLVGNFPTKDQARQFRDEMVQKYPSDYKDAWTTDIPQQ